MPGLLPPKKKPRVFCTRGFFENRIDSNPNANYDSTRNQYTPVQRSFSRARSDALKACDCWRGSNSFWLLVLVFNLRLYYKALLKGSNLKVLTTLFLA